MSELNAKDYILESLLSSKYLRHLGNREEILANVNKRIEVDFGIAESYKPKNIQEEPER